MSAQIVPFPSANQWRQEFLETLNTQLDQLEAIDMTMLEDITEAIFNQKSAILGNIILALIKKNHSHLLNQQFCECPNCARVLRVKNTAVERTIETASGKLTFSRPYFYCHVCKMGVYPLDEALGLAPGVKQYDVQELEAWLGSEMTFDKAAQTYHRFTGEKLSADHVHESANKIANHLDILDICPDKEEIAHEIKRFSEGKFRRPVMMLAIDGAHSPTRPQPSPWKGKRGEYEYKEVKGFRLYLLDAAKIIHLASWHQIQTDRELAEGLLAIKEAGLIPQDSVRVCVIGDGAAWIWNRIQQILPTAKQVLDFYHCSEYIHAVANLQYGHNSQKARQWTEATFTRLFNNGIDNVIHGLKIMQPVSDAAAEKIEKTIGYLTHHKDRINYGAAKRAGYHIGSGAIESANKYICHSRLKRSGAWWYVTNANNILKLRCALYNGTYKRIMHKYKELDRQKTYQEKYTKTQLHVAK